MLHKGLLEEVARFQVVTGHGAFGFDNFFVPATGLSSGERHRSLKV